MLKEYYKLTKPGIIYGNAITAIGGFFMATNGRVDIVLFAAMLLGLSLVIGSSCVLNNYIDRDIDAKMERTKTRALVLGIIPNKNALIFAALMGLLGIAILYFFTNLLALLVSLFGVFFYVVVYSMWGKRNSVYGTLIGSISGAVPPVVGYVAAANTLDVGAMILFAILCFWQMPHFYAISMYRYQDYLASGVPVLPIARSIRTTKIHILVHIYLFLISLILLHVFGYMGKTYLYTMSLLGLTWLYMGVQGFAYANDAGDKKNMKWARKLFLFSLVLITVFSVLISLRFLGI